MKVGIITITNGENYGNRLQNYAVQEALKDAGYQPETIHKTTNVFDTENPHFLWKIRLKKLLHYHSSESEKRILNFYRFTHKYIKRSRFIIDKNVPEGLEEEYTYFIAGSDQVWNPFFEYCTCENFLTFTAQDKKIAFSPSIAVESIPENKKENFKNWISDFRLLSIREQQGAKLIKELCGREAEVLGDPTLYVPAEKWRSIEKKVGVRKDGYILTYFLGNCPEEYARQIRQIARDRNLDIFELQTPEHFDIAPDEFLYLIDHAVCVCTDSFHGTIFSIIFHRPFLVFRRKENFVNMNSRIQDLLSMFHMEERISDQISAKQVFDIDFTESDSIILQTQEKIRNFLQKIDERKEDARTD